MRLVLAPRLEDARRFAKTMGDNWDAAKFGEPLAQRYDIIVVIQSNAIPVHFPNESVRHEIWQHVKTFLTPGNERNIYVL